MKTTILFFAIFLHPAFTLNAQEFPADSTDTQSLSMQPRLKAFHIAGATAIVGGASLGFVSNAFDDYPRKGLPLISATIAVAPASLIGLGLGELISKKTNKFTGTFKLASGVSYSSPIFSEFVPGNSHRAGINLSLFSPRLANWRYRFGFSAYLPEDYTFERIPAYLGETRLSWWELDLDLHYLIDINPDFTIYPLIGTQFNSVRAQGSQLNNEILANYGVGSNIGLTSALGLYLEIKYTIDLDDNPGNTIIHMGLSYDLK